MRWIWTAACYAAFATFMVGCSGVAAVQPRNFSVVEPSPSEGDLVPILKAEAAKAQELGQKPFVQYSATWCGPCKMLKKSFSDPLMQEALAGTYIIQIDIDKWNKQLRSVGHMGEAIPVFFEIDKEGHATGRSIDPYTWGDTVPQTMAPILHQFFSGE